MLGDIRLLLIFCGLLTGATLATVTGFGMSVGSLVFLSVISPALGVQLTTEERQWVLSTGAFAGIPCPGVCRPQAHSMALAPLLVSPFTVQHAGGGALPCL